MTAISEEPQAPTVIGLGLVFRLLAIALGIMSALLLSRDGLNVELTDLLDKIVDIYNGALEYVALLTLGPAIAAAFAALRDWFDWSLQLYPHWKHVTVLMWVYLGSAARYQDDRIEGPQVLNWIFAGSCAVVFGVAAGTVPMSHPGVFWFGAASFFVFEALSAASRATFNRLRPFPTWFSQFSLHGLPCLLLGAWCILESVLSRSDTVAVDHDRWFWPFAALSIYFLLVTMRYRGWMAILGSAVLPVLFVALVIGVPAEVAQLWQTSTNPSLAALVVLGVVQGIGGVFEGMTDEISGGLTNDVTQTGIDKLAVLGGAAFVVWLSNALA